MRYLAPSRNELLAGIFEQPLFASLTDAQRLLCQGLHWPDVADLNAGWTPPINRLGLAFEFKAQHVLSDALHYECRIDALGQIATRTENWHDLFNAFIWQNLPATKQALNAAQVEDIAAVGEKQRTRRQSAMTHFDEAGAIVRLHDEAMLLAWDAHDWPAFFKAWPEAEARGAVQVWPFGHSLYEHALNPDIALVAKALVFDSARAFTQEQADALIARHINSNRCLRDPQELRPIPLSGIPGWHRDWQSPDFFTQLGCFRPKRPGKVYSTPLAA
jgi:Protein of unknown function (DUF3025)